MVSRGRIRPCGIRKTPLEPRQPVTVCIAAACEMNGDREPAIVLCADRLKAGAMGGAETAFKFTFLAGRWMLMMSGDDDSDMRTVAMALRRCFAEHVQSGQRIDETNAGSLISEALRRWKHDQCDQIVASDWGLTYDAFRKSGRDSIPSDLYALTMRHISDVSPRVAFIVSGFAGVSEPFPYLFHYDGRDGRVKVRDEFALVGCGEHLAQAVLLKHEHMETRRLNRTLWTVFCAKKVAEQHPHVGWRTLMCVQRANGYSFIRDSGIQALHDRYDYGGDAKFKMKKRHFRKEHPFDFLSGQRPRLVAPSQCTATDHAT